MTEQNQHNPSLSTKVLEQIERDNIQPDSRLKMRAKNDAFWLLWLFSIIIGACAVAGTLFVLFQSDWRFYNATYDSFFSFIFDTLPYVWILTLLIFLLLAHQNIRHTKYGYRYPLAAILLLSVFSSAIGGTCLYVFGLGQIVDENVGSYIPLYEPVSTHTEGIWNNPERGLIAGDITMVAEDYSFFEITAFTGQKWRIGGEDLRYIDHLILAQNPQVKVIGVAQNDKTDPGLFHACMVLPWTSLSDFAADERNAEKERSNICKGVRPYEFLQGLQAGTN